MVHVSPKLIAGATTAAFTALSVYSSIYFIPETERGLVYTFGELTTDRPEYIKGPGLKLTLPFVQSIRKMPVGIQERVLDRVNIYSKDSQDFDARIQYVYKIPEANLIRIARQLGTNSQIDSVVENNVLQALKDSMGKREATAIPSERNDALATARQNADTLVNEAIGINITGMTMPNFDFNPTFKASVAAASQMKAEAEKARQAVQRDKAQADSAAAIAEGAARAKREAADADLYATQKASEGFDILVKSIGRENLSAYWFQKVWNGQLPQAVGGSNMTIMDMNGVAGAAMNPRAAAPAPRP